MLVGGHQRADVLKDGILEVEDLVKPEPDGTVGRGWLLHGDKRYVVRVVDWPEGKARAALLAANRFGRVGEDEQSMLKSILEELDSGDLDMDVTGYTEKDIEELMTACTELKPLDVKQPPRMAWVLIGVPLERWNEIAPMSESAATIEGSIVESTINDGIKEN